MKIVYCIFSLETGGAEVLTVGLLNEICHDHEVSLIIINNKWSDALLQQLNRKVKVYFINRIPGSRNLLKIVQLNKLLLRIKPDVLHSHDAGVASVIKVKSGKLLHTIHDVGLSVSAYKLYDKLIAISDAVYEDVCSKGRFPIKKIYNGVPVSMFKRRNTYHLLPGSSIRLIQISRLVHEKKGQDILLFALHKLRQEYQYHNFSLDFIGSGASFDYLKALVHELDLDENVNFIGEKKREWIFSNLCNYHILVQPSRYEGFGLTIIEGFAAGLPVLASNIDGPSEIIRQLPGGFLFDSENVTSCAENIYKLFSLYKQDEVFPLMQKTLPLVNEHYSLKSCAEEYVKEYEMLLAS